MTPQEVARLLQTPEQLSDLDHHTLLMARKYAPREQQGLLAPYEHRAYAREYVADNPLAAVPLAAMIPGYQLAKLLGGTNSRSAPSWSQAWHGLLGVGEGLKRGLLD